MARTDALIMAAGRGERFGGEPKQMVPLAGRPMLAWSLEQFNKHPLVDAITVVVAAGMEEQVRTLAGLLGFRKMAGIVVGGETRQDSVRLGLESLPSSSEFVLVHDAARPCVSAELITRVVEALLSCDAVVPTLLAVDTVVRELDGKVESVLDRKQIAFVQTPQGFRTELLRRAHEAAVAKGARSSDDGSLVLALDEKVGTVPGESGNMKVTIPEDFAAAEKGVLGRWFGHSTWS